MKWRQAILVLFFVHFITTNIFSQLVTITEDIEGVFPGPGWTLISSNTLYEWIDVTSGTYPTCSPHGGSWMAEFDSYFAPAGEYSALITPPFDLSLRGTNTPQVKFWIYRDNGYSSFPDKIEVFINTSPSLTGATLLTSTTGHTAIHRSRSLTPSGATVNGWYQYVFNVPSAFNGSTNYIIFKATSAYGNRIYIDDISYDTYPAAGPTQRQPFGMYWGYERSAAIYTQSEIGAYGGVSKLKWNIGALNSACTGNVKIYLKMTTATSFSTASYWSDMISGATLVYNGTPTFNTGTFEIILPQPYFNYHSNNLMVLVETNYGGTGGEGPLAKQISYETKTNAHQIWYKDNNPPGNSDPIWDLGEINSQRPKMNFTTVIISSPVITLNTPANNSYLATNGTYSWTWSVSGTLPITQNLTIEGTNYNNVSSPQLRTTGNSNPTAASYTWSVYASNAYGNQTVSRTYYRKKTITPTTSYQTETFTLPSSGSSFFYEVNLTSGRNYIFATCNHDHGRGAPGGSANFNTRIFLYNSSWVEVASNDDCGSGGTLSYLDYNCTSSGTYYVKIDGYGGAYGTYTMAYKMYSTGGTPGLWTGATSTAWNTASNWSNNQVPGRNTDVTIPAGCPNYPLINSGNLYIGYSTINTFECKSLTIEGGARVTVSGSFTINVKGNVLIKGTNNNYGALNHYYGNSDKFLIDGGTVTVEQYGVLNIGNDSINHTTGVPNGASTSQWDDIKIDNGGSLIINGGKVYIQDGLSHTNGSLIVTDGDLYIKYYGNGSGSGFGGYYGWECTQNSIINITNGTIHICGQRNDANARMLKWNASQNHTWTGGTLSLERGTSANNTGYVDFAGLNVNNLIINRSGLETYLLSNLTVNGNFTISNGLFYAQNYNIVCDGNLINNSSNSISGAFGFVRGTSTVKLTGSSKTIEGSKAFLFNNLEILSGASYTINPSGTFPNERAEVYGNFNLYGDASLNLASGKKLALYGANSTFDGTFSSASTDINNGDTSNTSTYELHIKRNTNLKCGGVINADVLIFYDGTNPSNTTVQSNEIKIEGDLWIYSGASLTMSNSTPQKLYLKGDWFNFGTFNCGISKVIFNGTSNQKIRTGGSYYGGSYSTVCITGKKFYNLEIDCGTNKVELYTNTLGIENDLVIKSGTLSNGNNTDASGNNGYAYTIYVKGNTTIESAGNLFVNYRKVCGAGGENIPSGCNRNIPLFEGNLSVHGTITTNRPVVSGYADIAMFGSKISGDGDENEFGVDIQPMDNMTAEQVGPMDIQGDLIIQAGVGNRFQCQNGQVLTIRGNLYIYRDFEHNGTVNVYGNMTNATYTTDNPSIANARFNFYHRSTGERIIKMSNPITFGDVYIKSHSSNGSRRLDQSIISNDSLVIETGRILNANNYNITVAGNWINNGLFYPNGSTQTVTFNGTSEIITGGTSIGKSFNHVTLNGTSAILKDHNMRVAGNLNINSGTFTIPSEFQLIADSTNGNQFNISGTLDIYGICHHLCGDYSNLFKINASGIVNVRNGAILNVGSNKIDGGFPSNSLNTYNQFNDISIDKGTLNIYDGAKVFIMDDLKVGPSSLGGTLNMYGGDLYIKYYGDGSTNSYGFDVYNNATLNISGGNIYICGQDNGASATMANWNTGCTANITGGTIYLENEKGAGSNNYTGYVNFGGKTLNNLVINRPGITTYIKTNDLFVKRDITIENGTFHANAKNITLEGNWTNNSTFTHGSTATDESGFVKFKGSEAQTISGSSPTTFYNLIIENSSTGVYLNSPINVTRKLGLVSGLLHSSSTNLVTLTDTAFVATTTYTGDATAGSATSFVNGPLKKIGRGRINLSGNSWGGYYSSPYTFTFPVGKNTTWARLQLTHFSGTTATTDAFTVEYFDTPYDDPDVSQEYLQVTSPLTNASNVEYWNIEKNSGNSNLYKRITLFSENKDRSGILAFNNADLCVAHWNNSTNKWETLTTNNTINSGSGTAGWIRSDNATNTFSPFTFASKTFTNPLSVEFLTFDAKLRGNVVDLFWITLNERNSSHFIVQKTIDFKNISDILKHPASGNTNTPVSYFDVDKNPTPGMSYYRVKEVDFNGNYVLTDWVPVFYDPNETISKNIVNINIFPNPAKDEINLILSTENIENAQTEIYDINGRLVLSKNLTLIEGNNLFKLDISQLKSGFYLIIVKTQHYQTHSKFIKVNP